MGHPAAQESVTSKQPAAEQPNVTELDDLFDQVGPETLCLSFALALAKAHGLTSAGIRFYCWLALRTEPHTA